MLWRVHLRLRQTVQLWARSISIQNCNGGRARGCVHRWVSTCTGARGYLMIAERCHHCSLELSIQSTFIANMRTLAHAPSSRAPAGLMRRPSQQMLVTSVQSRRLTLAVRAYLPDAPAAQRSDVEKGSSLLANNRAPAASVPPTVNWHLTPHCNYSCR